MKLAPPTTVRLAEDQFADLQRISDESRIDLATLIRTAVDGLIRHHKANGGRLVFPLKFEEIIAALGSNFDRSASPHPLPQVAETEPKIGSHIARSVAAEDPPEVTRPVIPLLSKSVSYRRRKK